MNTLPPAPTALPLDIELLPPGKDILPPVPAVLPSEPESLPPGFDPSPAAPAQLPPIYDSTPCATPQLRDGYPLEDLKIHSSFNS